MKEGTANGSDVSQEKMETEHLLNSPDGTASASFFLPVGSVQRSKFGRLRKPKISPYMEYTPLVRSQSSHSGQKQAAVGEKLKSSEPSEYLVGDLLWSKIGHHPFWPAMVSFDPVSGRYMKVIGKNVLLYHVQYFGAGAEHGWTQPRRVLRFEGLTKFVALGDLKRPPYAVPLRKRDAWMVAVEEATAAMELTRAERKQKLTFEYYDLAAKPTRNVKALRPLRENSSVEKPKDELCFVCEKTGATLACTGPCKMSFHLDCLGIAHPPAAFLCDECTTGKHPCLVCNKTEDTQKCSLESCGSFYHLSCLESSPLPLKEEPLVCPRHFCLYCFQQKPRSFSTKGRLLRCVRCPSTFHQGCLPAGSGTLNSTLVVCPRHGPPHHMSVPINVNWCMLCSKGGRLLCCEGCPAAMHEDCLGLQEVPEGAFHCPDCLEWKHPKYGDILWVKLGCYRWWPAQVCAPADVPANIQALKHEPVGDFAVRFYGSHDYYWTHRRRVFLFEEGDTGSLSASSKSVARLFEAALEEATLASEQQRKAREQCEKPAPFRMIRTNRPVCQASMPSADVHKESACLCDPKDPCRTDCLNRLMFYECSRYLCPAGEACENQRFQRRQYARASVIRSPGRGWGLQADQPLTAGDFVMEYVGELIDEVECQRRLANLHVENIQNFYFLTLEKDRIIDAGPRGNLSRFINHSCEPNCETQKWTVNGDTRVGIFAVCNIAPGTELTFNYNLDCRGNEKIPCACGAKNCSGYIGLRPRRPAEREPKSKRRKGSRGSD